MKFLLVGLFLIALGLILWWLFRTISTGQQTQADRDKAAKDALVSAFVEETMRVSKRTQPWHGVAVNASTSGDSTTFEWPGPISVRQIRLLAALYDSRETSAGPGVLL